MVEWNKERFPPFPCCPVICQCPWKKALIEEKKKNVKKEAGINFLSLSWSRNMIGRFMKTYVHKPIKILQFLARGTIQKCLTQLRNILAFPPAIWVAHLTRDFLACYACFYDVLNPLTTNVPIIFSANELTGFYTMGTMVVKGLKAALISKVAIYSNNNSTTTWSLSL